VAICYQIAGHAKNPLKGQDESPLSLDPRLGFFCALKGAGG